MVLLIAGCVSSISKDQCLFWGWGWHIHFGWVKRGGTDRMGTKRGGGAWALWSWLSTYLSEFRMTKKGFWLALTWILAGRRQFHSLRPENLDRLSSTDDCQDSISRMPSKMLRTTDLPGILLGSPISGVWNLKGLEQILEPLRTLLGEGRPAFVPDSIVREEND